MLSLHEILHLLLTIAWIVQLSNFKTVSAHLLNPLETFIEVDTSKTTLPDAVKNAVLRIDGVKNVVFRIKSAKADGGESRYLLKG